MANIAAFATTTSSVTSTLLTALGIDGWALRNGKYNGCTFASFVQVPVVQNNPLVQSGTNLFASINSLVGFTNGADANAFGQLYNTFLGTLQFSDDLMLEIVRKKLPFSNRCNTENMGSGGYIFKMTLLFLGPDYEKAITNFENAINNTPKSTKDNLVLIHPTRGKIAGITRVAAFRIDRTLANWNAATVNITFISEQTNGGSSNSTVISTVQKFTNVVQAGLGTVTGLTSTVANFQALVNSNNRIPTGQTSNVTYTKSSAISTSTVALSETLLNNINYIYKTSNVGINNPTLDSLEINYNKIPPVLNQSTRYSASQSTIILSYYLAQANEVITQINEADFGINSNDLINEITASIAALEEIAIAALNIQQTLSYVVPYTMSIRTVLAQNSQPLNNALSVLLNNPHIPSANYIPAGMVIQL